MRWRDTSGGWQKIVFYSNHYRCHAHYNDVIMGVMASQITSLTIVYPTHLFRCRSKKTSKLHVTGLCVGNSPVTSELPAQMASNAENVSIWWCRHASAGMEHRQSGSMHEMGPTPNFYICFSLETMCLKPLLPSWYGRSVWAVLPAGPHGRNVKGKKKKKKILPPNHSAHVWM